MYPYDHQNKIVSFLRWIFTTIIAFLYSHRKISFKKILHLNTDINAEKLSKKKLKEIKILECNADEIDEIFTKIKLENFSNAFVIEVKSKDENEEMFNNIKEKVNEKFPKTRPVLLKINSNVFLRRKNENFNRIYLLSNEKMIKNKVENLEFSTKFFLSIQKNSKISNWDFKRFLKFQENAEKFITLAISSQDDFCIRLLKLFDFKFSQEIKTEILHSAIRSRNFEVLLAVLNIFNEDEIDEEKIAKLMNKNAFLLAVESKNLKLCNFFFKKCKKHLNLIHLEKAYKIAIEKEFFEFFKLFNEIFLNDANNILKDIQNVHKSIESGNLEEVKSFNEKYPELKLCYGHEEICALERAIDCKKFEIFAFLRSSNFFTDKGKELDEKLSKLNLDEKRKICDENLKYIQDHPDSYIGNLLSKCKFDAKSPTSSDVHEMLTDLSRDEWLKVLLKRASEADIKIIFDMATKGINNMIPGGSQSSTGMALYNDNEVYVGRDAGKFERYGTFVHELSHMVFNLIYENTCLPYCEGDNEREEAWDKVLQNVFEIFKKNRDKTDLIIYFLFTNYRGKYNQHVELAVRPNHMLGKYLNNPQKIEGLKETFKELFDFYKNFILPDLQIPNVVQILKLNNDFGVIEEINENNLKLEAKMEAEFIDLKSKRLIITSNLPKLALKRLYTELKSSYPEKLDFKVKNLFVDPQNFYIKNDFFNIIKRSNIDRVIFDVNDSCELPGELINEIVDNVQIIIVSGLTFYDSFKDFDKSEIIFEWQNLKTETKNDLKEKTFNFQGNIFKVANFFETIPPKFFPYLCDKKEIQINCENKIENLQNFIPRKILKENEEFIAEDFIDEIDQKVVIISDVAGSGKTTFLKNLQSVLVLKKSEYWTSFVSLREHIITLSNKIGKNFFEVMIKILNLSEVEAEVFKLKFLKGEVRILFDAFDEISPKCKEETLKLFKLFLDQNEERKNQILITTRTHLEHDLENELKVESFKLKLLSEKDQINFLCNFWKNSSLKKNFVRNCAIETTKKISKLLKNRSNLIGVPLIIKIVGNLFIKKINKNFSVILKDIKLCTIYKEIIEEYLKILNLRFSEKMLENSFKNSSILQVHEYFTISYFFDEKFANKLGRVYYKNEWPLEEIMRCGILSCDENKKVHFNHQTYAEFLLAYFMENVIENVSNFSQAHLDLFNEILSGEKFSVTKIFLEEMLSNFEERSFKFLNAELNEKTFYFYETFYRFISGIKNVQNLGEKLANFSTKLSENVRVFFNEIENSSGRNFETFLNKILTDSPSVFENLALSWNKEDLKKFISKSISVLKFQPKNERKFAEFLVKLSGHPKVFETLHIEVEQIFGEKYFDNFLLENYKTDLLIFEYIVENLKDENLKKILFHKNFKQQTILHFTVKNFEIFEKILNSITKNASKEIQKEIIQIKDEEGDNILMDATWKNGNSSKIVFELIENLMEKKEVEKYLSEKNKVDNMLLNIASFRSESKENFEWLWLKVSEIVENPKEFFMQRGKFARNVLQRAAENENDPEIFTFAVNVAESFTKSNEERKKIFLEKNSEDHTLISSAISFAPQENLKILFEKLLEVFGEEEMKKILKTEKGFNERNLLCLFVQNKSLYSIEVCWKHFEKYLSQEELLELCYEEDKDGDNYLQIAKFSDTREIFKFLWAQIEKQFSDAKKIKSYLKLKGFDERNILQSIISRQDENLFQYALEDIFCKYFDLKDFIYERNKNGENLLHFLARYGSVSILEFSFEKFEKSLELEKLRNFMRVKTTKFQYNLLHCAALQNSDENSIKFLLEIIKKFLGENEIKKMLNEADKDNKLRNDYFPIHYAIRFNTTEIFEFLTELYEKYFSKDQIKSIFLKKDFNGLALLNTQNEKMQKIVKNYYERL